MPSALLERIVRTSFWGPAALLVLLTSAGCGAVPEGAAGPVGARPQAVPIGGACTDNTQCDAFDEDARLIICDVPAGMMAGTCVDCVAAATRPVGCACEIDGDCAAGTFCNGRTCQTKRTRGEFCLFDIDCGSDMSGAMRCLPTKSYCGPAVDGFFCDFDDDCLSNNCNDLGVCSSGAMGDDCAKDEDCKGTTICSFVTFKCVEPQADGTNCTRNKECQTRCNSFSGQCQDGTEGVACTSMNPDGDCAMGLLCTDCGGGAFTCRPMGSNCP
jgi:hypothetical protein